MYTEDVMLLIPTCPEEDKVTYISKWTQANKASEETKPY